MKTQLLTKESVLEIYRPANNHTHKGMQGHALLIGGSFGKIGSIALASKAALRSGCGLATAYIPQCGVEILQTAIPEIMVIADAELKHITEITFDLVPDAVGIGPGIGKEQATQDAFCNFLRSAKSPMVIDADALNILSQNKDFLSLLPASSILTPHPKELERLIGTWNSDSEKLEKTTWFSQVHHIIVVSKGARTQIIDGEKIFENTTGNASLATAGSGDVLTGIITGLLAQSYQPTEAALLGVYLHGLTADIALPEIGTEAFIASDIINYLGKAFLTLKNNHTVIGFK